MAGEISYKSKLTWRMIIHFHRYVNIYYMRWWIQTNFKQVRLYLFLVYFESFMSGKTRIIWFPPVENIKKKYRDKLVLICAVVIVTIIENVQKKDTDKSIRFNVYSCNILLMLWVLLYRQMYRYKYI